MLPEYSTKTTIDGTALECLCCHREVLVCADCGAFRYPGDWPQCPHAPGNFGEEPMEPYFDEHISTEGSYITTRSQRMALMSKNGMDYRKKRLDLIPGRSVHFDMGGRR